MTSVSLRGAVLLTLLAHPIVGAVAAEPADRPRSLRVVTYNLLHDGAGSGFLDGRTHLEERLDMAIRELKALDPDVITLQEASDSRRHGSVPERWRKRWASMWSSKRPPNMSSGSRRLIGSL